MGIIPRGSTYTTIMEFRPKRPSLLRFWGHNYIIVVCVYVGMYVCMYVCMCIYIYINIDPLSRSFGCKGYGGLGSRPYPTLETQSCN